MQAMLNTQSNGLDRNGNRIATEEMKQPAVTTSNFPRMTSISSTATRRATDIVGAANAQ